MNGVSIQSNASLADHRRRGQIGVQAPAEIAEASVSEFQRFLDVNVFGMFLATRAQSAAMKKQDPRPVSGKNARRGSTRGVIVNMASCSSFVATPMLVQYTTSKHAVLGLTKNAGAWGFSFPFTFIVVVWVFFSTLSKSIYVKLIPTLPSPRQRPPPNPHQLPLPLLGRHPHGLPSRRREPGPADAHGGRGADGPDRTGGRDRGRGHVPEQRAGELRHGGELDRRRWDYVEWARLGVRGEGWVRGEKGISQLRLWGRGRL